MRIGEVASEGGLDRNTIRRYVKRHLPKIQYCYERALLAQPRLNGTIDTSFFIHPDGTVGAVEARGVDPEVADCVADVLATIALRAIGRRS